MSTGDDERRWRNALERLGAANVRRWLQQSAGKDAERAAAPGIVEDAPHPSRGFIEAWYRDWQQRRQHSKHVRAYVLAVLALVAVGLLFLTMHR